MCPSAWIRFPAPALEEKKRALNPRFGDCATTSTSREGNDSTLYWDPEGPAANDTTDTMTQWGDCSSPCVRASMANRILRRAELFRGNNGWGTQTSSAETLTDRGQILKGALDYLSNVSNVINEPGTGGVYISQRCSKTILPRIRLYSGMQERTVLIAMRPRHSFRSTRRLSLVDRK